MRSIMIFITMVAVTGAAIHHPSPVYTRAPSVVSSSVGSPAGKSLVATNSDGPVLPTSLNQQTLQNQPIAEERESGFGTQEVGTVQAGSSLNSNPSASQGNPTNPQTFKIMYYPNAGSLDNPQGAYPIVPSQAYSPTTEDTEMSFWDKYYMTEVVVGVLSIALVVGGGALLYPRFVDVRARALRELADINSEDAARLTKNVFKALERLYEMNNAD